MTIRLNEYHDLPILHALYDASGKVPYPGWNWSSDTHGWWLIAEDEARRPLGCLQLYLSKPQAFLDLLCVPTVLPRRAKAVIVKALIAHALSLFKSYGVRTVSFAVDGWERIVTKRGAVKIHHHPTYMLQVS